MVVKWAQLHDRAFAHGLKRRTFFAGDAARLKSRPFKAADFFGVS